MRGGVLLFVGEDEGAVWACLRNVEDCMCAVLSSCMEDRRASIVCFACCIARCRYPVACPMLLSLMLGNGRVSGDWTRRVVLQNKIKMEYISLTKGVC